MKNLHLLVTDKPSRLFVDNDDNKLRLYKVAANHKEYAVNKNIYITSDEEIKEGDWFLLDMSHSSHPNEVHQMGHNKWSKTGGINFSEPNSWTKACKKIILTTDQDLINDGVQAIDDAFLQWFVKNPSCEFVKVNVFPKFNLNDRGNYGIIIPKEEANYNRKDEILWISNNPQCKQVESCYNSLSKKCICPKEHKQETLEEAFDKIYNSIDFTEFDFASFKLGAKWQQERSYSEEDFKIFARKFYREIKMDKSNMLWEHLADLCFEQFKKK